MTGKTVEELEVELSDIKEELADTKVKMKELLLFCKNISKSFALEKTIFKCDECEEKCESFKDLKTHKNEHRMDTKKLQCEKCDREFDEKWKLNAHIKSHEYKCEVCDETFKSADIRSKHVKISHENLKLFCHFYNNRIDCPYGTKCVFKHEDAPLCRFGARCERINCMFKHIILEYSNDDEDDEDETDEDETDEDESVVDDNPADGDTDVAIREIETVELKVYLKCRDQWLSKDQVYYTDELKKFKEIERIENLWINAKSNYEIGTYLETNLKIHTKYAKEIKNNKVFRQSLWDRLEIKDTCPDDQGVG